MDAENDLISREAAERIRTEKCIYFPNVSGEMCAETKENQRILCSNYPSNKVASHFVFAFNFQATIKLEE
jgi:hypothetical protein